MVIVHNFLMYISAKKSWPRLNKYYLVAKRLDARNPGLHSKERDIDVADLGLL